MKANPQMKRYHSGIKGNVKNPLGVGEYRDWNNPKPQVP